MIDDELRTVRSALVLAASLVGGCTDGYGSAPEPDVPVVERELDVERELVEAPAAPEQARHFNADTHRGGLIDGETREKPVERQQPPPPSACRFDEPWRATSRGRVLTFVMPDGRSETWPLEHRACVWTKRGELLASVLSEGLEWAVYDDYYMLSLAGLTPDRTAFWALGCDCVLRVHSLAGSYVHTYRFETGGIPDCHHSSDPESEIAISFRRYASNRTIGARLYGEWIYAQPDPVAEREN